MIDLARKRRRLVYLVITFICFSFMVLSISGLFRFTAFVKKEEKPILKEIIDEDSKKKQKQTQVPGANDISQEIYGLYLPSYNDSGEEVSVIRGAYTIFFDNKIYKITKPEIAFAGDSNNDDNDKESKGVVITSDFGEMEDLKYGQADLRLRKEFITDNGSFNISFGLSGRSHPVYGFAPTIIDSSWYTGSWWDFAEDEFGVDDRGYTSDLNGDGIIDGNDHGVGIYDNKTGEYIGRVGHDWRWFDRDGNLMAMTDREFYQYHFPRLLENWFDKQTKALGNQRELSVSLGLDWYQYTDNWWMHVWGSLFPYHYGMDKYSYHNAVAWKEHEEDGKEPEEFVFEDKGTGVWYDYDYGAIIGFKLQDNLGVFIEGKYLNYWDRPAYDIKVGLNYQFVGFGL